MTRELDVRLLVEAFTLPGSDAEATYREALEGREPVSATAFTVAELARVLVAELGWEPAMVELAVAQVEQVTGAGR
jgi:predicted nucleic acid-binding protein